MSNQRITIAKLKLKELVGFEKYEWLITIKTIFRIKPYLFYLIAMRCMAVFSLYYETLGLFH